MFILPIEWVIIVKIIMSSKMISFLSTCWKSDYVTLAKFLVPLAFTDVVVDIGEQVCVRPIVSAVV